VPSSSTASSWPGSRSGQPHAYRLDVLCSDIADVVQSIGGWLFDQAMAGRQIGVIIGAGQDPRPLQILGIGPHRLYDATVAMRPAAIAVAADVLDRDNSVRNSVVAALHSGGGEVTVWGRSIAAEREFDHYLGTVQYPLSSAARAFKTQALIAARATVPSLDHIELFRASSGKMP
jgi:hypothetical protein